MLPFQKMLCSSVASEFSGFWKMRSLVRTPCRNNIEKTQNWDVVSINRRLKQHLDVDFFHVVWWYCFNRGFAPVGDLSNVEPWLPNSSSKVEARTRNWSSEENEVNARSLGVALPRLGSQTSKWCGAGCVPGSVLGCRALQEELESGAPGSRSFRGSSIQPRHGGPH